MLYRLTHYIRDHQPWIWQWLESINSMLFHVRYHRAVRQEICDGQMTAAPFRMLPISEVPTEELVAFFARQPEEAFRWFRPHGFDPQSIRQLQRNHAFLAFVLKEQHDIVGYFFLRCSAGGSCYLGRMVDYRHYGKGIATQMNRISIQMSEAIHLKSYQTISPENLSSLGSTKRAYRLQLIETLPNGDQLYRNLPL